MKALRSKMRMLEDQINNNKYKKALKSIFTDDQVKDLFAKKHSVRSWSEDTIHRGKCDIFECYNLLRKIIVRFVVFRLRIYNKRKSISLFQRYDCKSMYNIH